MKPFVRACGMNVLRRGVRLPAWHEFCEEFIAKLPCSEFITEYPYEKEN